MKHATTALAENLRRRRILRGIRQVDIAELVGVSRVTYGKFERGKATPTERHLWDISAVLHVPIPDLLRPDPKPRAAVHLNMWDRPHAWRTPR